MSSYEVVVSSREDNTDTIGHRFPTRDEADMARASVLEWFPHAHAEVVERQEPATITYATWMERGW